MSDNLEKLRKLLAELFQLEQADLDFGIYRIMNQKRDEITRFLYDDLLPQVQEAFKEYQSSDRVTIEAELRKFIQQAESLGIDPDTSPKVQDQRKQLSQAVDITKLENEVFSDLYSFFRRYYDNGDFISLRRYKEGVYAIPYEGEEVKLYWANQDQYYIKTSEYFRDYTFKLTSGKHVHFKLADADTEKDNQKAVNGLERRFSLKDSIEPPSESSRELSIRFQYSPDTERRKQSDINTETVRKVFESLGTTEWRRELSELRPTEKNQRRTLLEKHINDYTARNTFDYFIHKDLGGFLRRELDFYIKNEIMHLDDIESESVPKVEQYLSKIKVVRKIAHKVIDFLAQIENFQKKLWLKKKFVVETNYCVTLDRVPEKLYPEIIANDAQREEWVRLFAIDEINGDLAMPSYSVPLTEEFLKANPFLVLDTQFFSQKFKDALLVSFEDIDEQCDGLLIHSENFNALKLLRKRYKQKIKCIYIDPPFNTGGTDFIYKNGYQHSSWYSMMLNVLSLVPDYLSDEGVFLTAIDDFEIHELSLVTDLALGRDNRLGVLVVEIKPSGRTNDNFLATCHEYYLCYSRNSSCVQINFFELDEEQKQQYSLQDGVSDYKWRDFLRTGGYSTPRERPNSFYPIFFNPKTNQISLEASAEFIEILPIDSSGKERVWRKTRPSFQNHVESGDIMIKQARSDDYKVYIKDRIKSGVRPKSVWIGSKYDAASHGTKLIKSMMGPDCPFSFPKSLYAVMDIMKMVTSDNEESFDVVLDFFAGSGTTAHAVIQQNQIDDGNRKYILVERAEYIYSVLIPRIKKAIYSKDWKEGKPGSRKGSSQLFKYIRLESYEDTLNNLELKRTSEQDLLLAQYQPFRESYMLSYMLDVESKGSPSLLNIEQFEDPFNYKLNISTGSAGETKPVNVDLVETFNYLIGLTVQHIDHIRGFRVVQGTNPKGEKVLIIWRNLKEKSNNDLEEFFRRQEYNPRDMEFDLIYINGDNNLENIKRPDETWKVRLIEEDFMRLMFDVEDV